MEEMRNRAVIENVRPAINDGQYALKRIAGDRVSITADIYADGHDVINAWIYLKHQSERTWSKIPMQSLVNDAWFGGFTVHQQGRYSWYIQAWVDYALNWQHELDRKVKGGQHVDVELLDGLQYLQKLSPKDAGQKAVVRQCKELFKNSRKYTEAVQLAISRELREIFYTYPYQTHVTRSQEHSIWVDREKAGFSAWYEFFPRSTAATSGLHGTFRDAAQRLPYVSELGFDVVYLPPIHPIGEVNRKGKNNATIAEPGDVGSPWAIGSRHGGHKDINPALGTLQDFKAFVTDANALGMEVAMDFALQCAPDHPYVKEHPQWFRWRPDGTVQYAENPPKKYQDILPFYFETDDWQNLWKELLSVVMHWISQGVTIFRVDNPHTKPFNFWEWLIASVHDKHPDILFLSEAFTRPKIMHRLAKIGFSQSYTYYTWRNNKAQLSEYLTELTSSPSRDYFRPNFWPNTPDILPYELQHPSEAAFMTRYFMAATMSGNYGMYGPAYENMLYQAVPGKEEYLDSEKYEIGRHVWDMRGKLKQLIKIVNQIRRNNPAFKNTYNLELCRIDNEHIIAYYKSDGQGNHILCVVNLDPFHSHGGWVQVPLEQLQINAQQGYQVFDLITQSAYQWHGEWNYIELNPQGLPFHCFQILV